MEACEQLDAPVVIPSGKEYTVQCTSMNRRRGGHRNWSRRGGKVNNPCPPWEQTQLYSPPSLIEQPGLVFIHIRLKTEKNKIQDLPKFNQKFILT